MLIFGLKFDCVSVDVDVDVEDKCVTHEGTRNAVCVASSVDCGSLKMPLPISSKYGETAIINLQWIKAGHLSCGV